MKYRGLPPLVQGLLWLLFGVVAGGLLTASLPGAVAAVATVVAHEPEKLPWIASRATAFLAYGCLAASTLYGLAMTTKLLDVIARRVITSTLHEDLALAGLVFAGAHAVLLLFDRYIGYTWADLLIPGASAYEPVATAFGILAFYATVLLILSSKLRRLLGVRLWRAIHLVAFAGAVLMTVHGLVVGSDSNAPWAIGIYLAATTAFVFLLVVRLLRKLSGADRRPVSVS